MSTTDTNRARLTPQSWVKWGPTVVCGKYNYTSHYVRWFGGLKVVLEWSQMKIRGCEHAKARTRDRAHFGVSDINPTFGSEKDSDSRCYFMIFFSVVQAFWCRSAINNILRCSEKSYDGVKWGCSRHDVLAVLTVKVTVWHAKRKSVKWEDVEWPVSRSLEFVDIKFRTASRLKS